MIRLKKDGPPEVVLDDNEIEFLAKLYQDIKDKTETFEQYIETYKKTEIEKFTNSKKEQK